MNRRECLDAAAAAVLSDRAKEYGPPEQNFAKIAAIWQVVTGREYQPEEVALMLAAVKMARLAGNIGHADSWVDLAGYAACGVEIATAPRPARVVLPDVLARVK